MDIKHILVATDLSGAARQCYAPAAVLATALGARITVLHVDEFAADGYRRVEAFEHHLHIIATVRQERIQQVEQDFAALLVPVEVIVARGDAKQVIDETARSGGVDLIVMAKRSRWGVERLFMGSTTKRMLRLCPTPLLIVPVDEDLASQPPLQTPRFNHLLAPTDLGTTSRAGLQVAISLARQLGARVTAAHIIHWPALVPMTPGEVPISLPHAEVKSVQDKIEVELASQLGDLGDERDQAVVRTAASPVDGLCTVAEELGVDMLVVPSTGKGRMQRLLLGSTTERLAKKATVPVMVLPDAFLEAWQANPERGRLSE